MILIFTMNKLVNSSCYLFLAIIFILSVIKINDTNLPEQSDKIVHFFMYFLCSAAIYLLKFKHFIILSVLYGIFIEIVQYFIPWRSFSIADIVANCFGAITFLIFLKYYKKSKNLL